MENIMERIEQLMHEKAPDWRWSDLARAMGVTDQNIYNWRKRGVPAGRHKKLAQVLGVSIDALNGSVGVSEPSPTYYEHPHQPAAAVQMQVSSEDAALLADLQQLLPEDAAVWRAQIRAAAVKMKREFSTVSVDSVGRVHIESGIKKPFGFNQRKKQRGASHPRLNGGKAGAEAPGDYVAGRRVKAKD
jgi:hypothetical protein